MCAPQNRDFVDSFPWLPVSQSEQSISSLAQGHWMQPRSSTHFYLNTRPQLYVVTNKVFLFRANVYLKSVRVDVQNLFSGVDVKILLKYQTLNLLLQKIIFEIIYYFGSFKFSCVSITSRLQGVDNGKFKLKKYFLLKCHVCFIMIIMLYTCVCKVWYKINFFSRT